MKKNPFAVLALLTASLFSVTIQSHAATQTLDGMISDSMCGKKHMMPGKPDAECVKECIKACSSSKLNPVRLRMQT